MVARSIFIHVDPGDPIHYGEGGVTVYDDTLHLQGDFKDRSSMSASCRAPA
jgi:hypothetical protein